MRHPIPFLALAGLIALVAAGIAPAQDAEDRSEMCAMCHDELAAEFSRNVHALAGRGGPSCETCHGDGANHMDEGDPALISKPAGRDMQGLCLDCHALTLHSGPAGAAAHAAAEVHCDSCHRIHQSGLASRRLLTKEPTTLCASCHPAQAGSFRRPFGHRLEGGGMDCVSCHNPHGGPGERSLRQGRTGEGPCLSCHAEKRGPFVFSHVSGVTGDCLSCHQAHRSSNPMQLTRSRVDQLCLECHSVVSAPTLGSQPPSVHDLRSPRYRECTVCHVAVHGSNTSPTLLR